MIVPKAVITLDENVKVVLEQIGIPNGCQIKISGQVDTYNSTKFQDFVNIAIKEGYRNFVFDGSALSYLSSTGVGAFTYILKALKDVNGNMVFAGIPQRVVEVFNLLGFSSFFEFQSNMAEAISLLGGSQKPALKPIELKPIFPLIFSCPFCGKKYKINKAGRYRCSSCSGQFGVNNNGGIV